MKRTWLDLLLLAVGTVLVFLLMGEVL